MSKVEEAAVSADEYETRSYAALAAMVPVLLFSLKDC